MASNDLTVDNLIVNDDAIATRLNVSNLGFVETGQNDTMYIWPSNTSFITTKNTTGPTFLAFADGSTSFAGYLGSVGGFSMNTVGGAEGLTESTFTWRGNVLMTEGASIQLGTVAIANLTLASSIIIQGGASITGDSVAEGSFTFQNGILVQKGITIQQTDAIGDLTLGTGVKLITSETSDISANAGLSLSLIHI